MKELLKPRKLYPVSTDGTDVDVDINSSEGRKLLFKYKYVVIEEDADHKIVYENFEEMKTKGVFHNIKQIIVPVYENAGDEKVIKFKSDSKEA